MFRGENSRFAPVESSTRYVYLEVRTGNLPKNLWEYLSRVFPWVKGETFRSTGIWEVTSFTYDPPNNQNKDARCS